jgi:hypothetical protein
MIMVVWLKLPKTQEYTTQANGQVPGLPFLFTPIPRTVSPALSTEGKFER